MGYSLLSIIFDNNCTGIHIASGKLVKTYHAVPHVFKNKGIAFDLSSEYRNFGYSSSFLSKVDSGIVSLSC